MISADRLDEIETLAPPDDLPDEARVTLPARDVRDLVALVRIARCARYVQCGYAPDGYPVFACEGVTLDGHDMVKLNIEDPLEGWLTTTEKAALLQKRGAIRNQPR